MLKTLHTLSSYGFVLVFLVSCGLAAMALRRKEIKYERLSAWSFVAAFGLLALAYGCGFPLEKAMAGAPKAVTALAARHHDMAKFVLTGMTLTTAASLTVLYKFRNQRFPGWFLPNLLFLALTIATFSIRSVVYAFQLDAHPARHAPAAGASPSPAASGTP